MGKIMDRQLGMLGLDISVIQSINQRIGSMQRLRHGSLGWTLDSAFSNVTLLCRKAGHHSESFLMILLERDTCHALCGVLPKSRQAASSRIRLWTGVRVTGIHPLELFDGAPPHEGQPGNRDVGGDPTWRRWPFTRRLPIRAHPRDHDGFNTCPLTSPNCSSCWVPRGPKPRATPPGPKAGRSPLSSNVSQHDVSWAAESGMRPADAVKGITYRIAYSWYFVH